MNTIQVDISENAATREIREALRTVVDPEVGVNIVDLRDARLRIELTMTSPACPAG